MVAAVAAADSWRASRRDGEIVAFLHALEQDISERGAHPARIELNCHQYVMHPAADAFPQDAGDDPVAGV